MIFCAGIRSDNFVSGFYLIILISELIKLQGSLRHHLQITAHITQIRIFQDHGADITHVVNDRTHLCPVRSGLGHDTDQSASGDHIHIHFDPITGTLVDNEHIKPVTCIFSNNIGRDLIQIRIIAVQIVKISQLLKFIAFLHQHIIFQCQFRYLFLQALVLLVNLLQICQIIDS